MLGRVWRIKWLCGCGGRATEDAGEHGWGESKDQGGPWEREWEWEREREREREREWGEDGGGEERRTRPGSADGGNTKDVGGRGGWRRGVPGTGTGESEGAGAERERGRPFVVWLLYK